jgi:hypothetical protein
MELRFPEMIALLSGRRNIFVGGLIVLLLPHPMKDLVPVDTAFDCPAPMKE